LWDPVGVTADSAQATVRPLVRVRQFREFTGESPTETELDAILDAARWTGSSVNSQPWRFVVIRDRDVIARISAAGVPQTRGLATAPVAVAIVLPLDEHAVSRAYDEGRVAERLLLAASMLGLGAGISWIRRDVLPLVIGLLGLPPDRFVRTIVQVGHPTEAARAPKSKPGEARLPRDQVVFRERWPAG
jgi:nitroreductase